MGVPGVPGPVRDVYAGLSTGYAQRRRPDPRSAERIEAALGTARTVVTVGAGAGSPSCAGSHPGRSS
ncbi:hypothetical protein [Pseudonocardia sp. NPDC046786]|uniref:hypothetical protein n=1 Tax=Pseudonocardia sp. NPDC046786 TaxID=3155471 RepID=UPI0033DDD465